MLIIKDPYLWVRVDNSTNRVWVGCGIFELCLEGDKYFFKAEPSIFVSKDSMDFMIKAGMIEVVNVDNNELIDTGEE